MTPEQFQELDRLVDMYVFSKHDTGLHAKAIPPYSSEAGGAQLVIKKMEELGYPFGELKGDDEATVWFEYRNIAASVDGTKTHPLSTAFHENRSVAVVWAALKVKGKGAEAEAIIFG